MDISTYISKAGSEMHLKVAKLKDPYLNFTQIDDASNAESTVTAV